ncbi:MAG: hypothetical protein HQL53_07800 [Magnetococcales bacterium]|nr:hypothetical protein [Magnetococcales bacterium]
MTISEVEICNMALGHLGVGEISALTEASAAGKVCNALYSRTRDELLRLHPWNFAQKTDTLALLSGESATGWSYVYAWPAHAVSANEIVQSDRSADPIQYEVLLSSDGTGRIIATDQDSAALRYTYQVTDPNLFDALFVDALSWRLATKIGLRLKTAKSAVLNAVNKSHEIAMAFAMGVDSNERKPNDPAESSFVLARY